MQVRRMVAIVLVAFGAGLAAALVAPGSSAGADTALVDFECDLPPAGGLLGGQIPDKYTLQDLEVTLDESTDPVVQGQPVTYAVDLPVPNLTDGLDLPPEGAPYGTLEVNFISLTVPIPSGISIPSGANVTISPSKPWLTASVVGPNLVFWLESTVAGNSPNGRSPMRVNLDAPTADLQVQQSPGVWVSVLPLPDISVTGTATGVPGSSISWTPPSLLTQVQYEKSIFLLLDIDWDDRNVPCVPLAPSQVITSTLIAAPNPALSVTKALGPGDDTVAVGETIDYTVTVANTGNVPLSGITLSDPNATCEAVATTLAVGASDDVACTHVAVEGDIGTYSNTATGDSTETAAVASNQVDTTVVEAPLVCTPPEFPDVPEAHPFFEEICWMVDAGVTTGFQDGTFKPGGNVTRQAMAAFLHRLDGDVAPVGCTQQFSDVPTSHPFFDDICWMVQEGVTGGFPNGTFKPGGLVSRAAMAAFLYRFDGEPAFTPPGAPSFPDVALTHPFFTEIEWMAGEEITGGFLDGTFRPSGNVTRQSMAAFLFRFANRA